MLFMIRKENLRKIYMWIKRGKSPLLKVLCCKSFHVCVLHKFLLPCVPWGLEPDRSSRHVSLGVMLVEKDDSVLPLSLDIITWPRFLEVISRTILVNTGGNHLLYHRVSNSTNQRQARDVIPTKLLIERYWRTRRATYFAITPAFVVLSTEFLSGWITMEASQKKKKKKERKGKKKERKKKKKEKSTVVAGNNLKTVMKAWSVKGEELHLENGKSPFMAGKGSVTMGLGEECGGLFSQNRI